MVRWKRTSERGLAVAVMLGTVMLGLSLTARTSAAAPGVQQTSSSPSFSGAEAVARAKTWVDAKIGYSQTGYHDGYRTDCVGFVSMAWGIAPPGMGDTSNVLNYVTKISPDDLQPGDALLNTVGEGDPGDWRHIILFVSWVPGSNHKLYNGYEEAGGWGGAHDSEHVPFPYYGGPNNQYDPTHYQAVRYTGFADPSQPAFYANKIVQWDHDTKAQKTAWLVTPDLKRLWIPDIPTYNCLIGLGVPPAVRISSKLLDQLPDLTGRSVLCGSMQPVSVTITPTPTTPPVVVPTHTPTPTPPPAPAPGKSIQIGWSSAHPTWIWMTFNGFAPGTYTYACTFSTPPQSSPFTIVETTEPQTWDNGKTCYDTQAGDHVWVVVNGVSSNTLTVGPSAPPPPQTFPETAGPGGSGTYTNYTNAGGTLGQRVAAYQTIQVTCRLTGFKVQDGNTWWYKVASNPWDNQFYASADNYYNNGQTSGSLSGTPFYDSKVPVC